VVRDNGQCAVDYRLAHDGKERQGNAAGRRLCNRAEDLDPSNIIGAFRRCAFWHLDPAAMQARVAANMGIVQASDTTLQQEAPAVAAGVLQKAQQRIVDTRPQSVRGQATVPRGILHSPEALLAQHSVRETSKAATLLERESKAAKVEERRAPRDAEDARRAVLWEHNRCRVCCETVVRGGTAWVGCVCNTFWVCLACA